MSNYHIMVYDHEGNLIETDVYSSEKDASEYRERKRKQANVQMVVVKYR